MNNLNNLIKLKELKRKGYTYERSTSVELSLELSFSTKNWKVLRRCTVRDCFNKNNCSGYLIEAKDFNLCGLWERFKKNE